MNCPSCNTPNPDGSRFCLRCGNPIPVQAAPSAPQTPQAYPPPQQQATAGPVRSMRPIGGAPGPAAQPQAFPQQPNYQQPPPASAAPQTVRMPDDYSGAPAQPPAPPQYAQSSAPQQQYAQPYQVAPQVPQQYAPPQNQQQQYVAPSSSQISTSALNIWGPFAGYGARRRHIGWLMDNQAGRHTDLLKSINKRLKERQIPGVDVNWRNFTAQGVLVETRPYFLIKKGLVSLALNVGTFGKDLFISMATYLKPPVSIFRVLAVAAMSTIGFLGYFVLGWAGQNAVSMGGGGLFGAQPAINQSAIILICLFGPLHALDILALLILLIYSIYKFIRDKDFLAALRVPPNEFNEDDLMALEKAVEQTVRSGLDDIGLNPADLKPTAVKGSEQRLI